SATVWSAADSPSRRRPLIALRSSTVRRVGLARRVRIVASAARACCAASWTCASGTSTRTTGVAGVGAAGLAAAAGDAGLADGSGLAGLGGGGAPWASPCVDFFVWCVVVWGIFVDDI